MRVAGIYPQTTNEQNIISRSTYGEPLGLGKMLSIAEQAGCEVLYEMPIGESLDDLIDRVETFDPDIIALSLMTCQVPAGEYVARQLKKSRKDRFVVAGGYHPSAMNTVPNPFDVYIKGEGEIPFEALISALKKDGNLDEVPGILFRTSDGCSDEHEPPERIRDLDRYPWALRSDPILRQTYFGLIYPPASQQTGFAFVEYGRGCKWKCIYCCKEVIWKNELTYRNAADVVQEMLWLQREKHVNFFAFMDLNFTSSVDKVLSLCNGSSSV